MKVLILILFFAVADTTIQKQQKMHENIDSMTTKMDSIILILEQKKVDTLK